MRCVHPLSAYRTRAGEVVFKETADCVQSLFLPCGQCVCCRLKRSRHWAARCVNEASLYDSNSFVTLTYAPEHLPIGASLEYRDFQLFMKRLRRRAGSPVRFYMCGEYGEKLGRPHFHACLFGMDFPDKVRIGGSGDTSLYQSKLLDELWEHKGHASVGQVTFESAAYVARYCVAKVTGKMADDYYRRVDPDTGELFRLVPEFNRMSLKPGIGMPWLDRFRSDVYPDGRMVVRGKLCSPPRAYDKRFKKESPDDFEWMQYMRIKQAELSAADNTDERLRVLEEVTNAGVRMFNRNKENM